MFFRDWRLRRVEARLSGARLELNYARVLRDNMLDGREPRPRDVSLEEWFRAVERLDGQIEAIYAEVIRLNNKRVGLLP